MRSGFYGRNPTAQETAEASAILAQALEAAEGVIEDANAAELAKNQAQGHATNAATSASQAATSASNAATSASTASTHAATATTQASNAASSASAAATSASNASTSATAASGSAQTATTKAAEAAASATAAQTFDPANYARVDGSNMGPYSFRNKLMNGDFRINQRGLASYNTNLGYTADRWSLWHLSVTGPQAAISALAVNEIPQTQGGCINQCVLSGTLSGSNGYLFMRQPIENLQTLAGRRVLISFWALKTAGTQLGVRVGQDFGTGGSAQAIPGFHKINNLTTGWVRYSFVVDMPSLAGKTLGPNHHSFIDFVKEAGSTSGAFTSSWSETGTLAVTGVQVEIVGPAVTVPTPFELRPTAYELMLCQRYFERTSLVVTAAGAPTGYWKVDKRVIPTVTATFNVGTGATITPLGTSAFFQSVAHNQVGTATVSGESEL